MDAYQFHICLLSSVRPWSFTLFFWGGDLVSEIPGDKWKNGLNLYEDANSWLVFKKW